MNGRNRKILAAFGLLMVLILITSYSSMASGSQPDGPVKLTGLVYLSPQTQDVGNMQWMKKAEEAAGVEIEWQQVYQTDWPDLKGPLLASGDIPDILIGGDAFQPSDFVTFKGLFMDLSKLVENAPNIQKMFADHPDFQKLATMEGGEIYGVPKYQRWWPQSWYRQYINKQWLDDLGLDMPQTWDDLYNVLKAFKERDPNGNGESDEVPLNFVINVPGSYAPYILLSNYGFSLDLFRSSYGFYVDNGQVKNFLATDEYKELAKFYNKLYSEGLLYSAAFTDGDSPYVALGRQGEDKGNATYGMFWAWTATDIVGAGLADQYVALPPLKATADQELPPTWTYEFEQLNIKPIAAAMSAKCSNPEAAMRFIDALYDPTTSLEILFGDLGTSVMDNGDGTYRVSTPAEAGDTEGMDAGAWKWRVTMADLGPGCIDDSMVVELPADLKAQAVDSEPFKEALGLLDMKTNALHYMFLKFTDEELAQLALIESNIRSLCEAQFADWVANGGVDAGWESYTSSFQSTGVNEALAIYQRAYDEYLK